MPGRQYDTTETFIKKAQEIHGDRYDYNLVEYVDSYTDVVIVCLVHGNFTQRPNNHLHGAGCRQCGIENKDLFHRMSRDEFIGRAKAVHGNRYDYALVDYKNSREKVTIVCLLHGQFYQTPSSHLKGANCPKCSYKDRGLRLRRESYKPKTKEVKIKTPKLIKPPLAPRIIIGSEGDYHELAEAKGYKWLGPLPKGINEDTWWLCKNNHKWCTTYVVIKNRKVCHYCSQRARKTTEDYLLLADASDLEWIGDALPGKVTHKTWWRCKRDENHKWFTSYNVIHQGARCPYCSGKYIRIAEDYSKIAMDRRFEWLGPEVETTSILTEWKCKKNHTWWASYSNIHNRKSGCPHCKESKGESRVARYLDQFTLRYERQKRFDACRNEMQLPFDFYFSIGNKVFLVEYDGILHFEIPEQWGGEKVLKEVQKRDRIKTNFAQENGFILIRIPYTIETIEQYLQDEIKKYLGYSLKEDTGGPASEMTMSQREKF
jgi:hypothetical protein